MPFVDPSLSDAGDAPIVTDETDPRSLALAALAALHRALLHAIEAAATSDPSHGASERLPSVDEPATVTPTSP
jgi:hypothetical protein